MEVREILEKLKGIGDPAHDYTHALRVYRLAMYIASKEGGNKRILKYAALLHDLFDKKINKPEVALEILEKCELAADEKQKVLELCKRVKFDPEEKVTWLEEKILKDADRLDAMGAIGVARAFSYGAKLGRPFYIEGECLDVYDSREEYEHKGKSKSTIAHFYEKLLRLKDFLYTRTAKKFAERRHKFLELFLKEFFEEWYGKT